MSGYSVQVDQAGGGALIDSHILDKILYWFGEPTEVTYADDNHGGVEANCKGTMYFRDVRQSFFGSFFVSKTIALQNRIVIHTDQYTCRLDEREDALPVLEPHDKKWLAFEIQPMPMEHQRAVSEFLPAQ